MLRISVAGAREATDIAGRSPIAGLIRPGFALVLLVAVLTAGDAAAQSRAVAGYVGDAADGAPLPGATVAISGTTVGTTTDAAGRFALALAGLKS